MHDSIVWRQNSYNGQTLYFIYNPKNGDVVVTGNVSVNDPNYSQMYIVYSTI